MDIFASCFLELLDVEKGLSTSASDPGNWTGGQVGRGQLLGTKYGISAAAFPTLAIPSLTEDQARAIYQHLYWTPIAGDSLPPRLAMLALDAAVNNGVERAVRWMQAAAGAVVDGVLGPATLAAVGAAHARDDSALLVEFQVQRLMFMAALPLWAEDGLGWARRLCGLPFRVIQLTQGS